MRDHDVREEVWKKLRHQHEFDPETLMLDELGILNGSTRIDIAVVNGEIAGFELKSERDNLERLPMQCELYNKVLDRISLVVAENHRKQAIDLISPWWGVWIAHPTGSGRVEVSLEREPELNSMIQPEALCSFLWRNEALAILERFSVASGVRSKPREALYKRMADVLPLELIKSEVRVTLKGRQGWRADRRFLRDGDSRQ